MPSASRPPHPVGIARAPSLLFKDPARESPVRPIVPPVIGTLRRPVAIVIRAAELIIAERGNGASVGPAPESLVAVIIMLRGRPQGDPMLRSCSCWEKHCGADRRSREQPVIHVAAPSRMSDRDTWKPNALNRNAVHSAARSWDQPGANSHALRPAPRRRERDRGGEALLAKDGPGAYIAI